MKKCFSQSISLSNWSAVISANDAPRSHLDKEALPLFCEGRRPQVPLRRIDSCVCGWMCGCVCVSARDLIGVV